MILNTENHSANNIAWKEEDGSGSSHSSLLSFRGFFMVDSALLIRYLNLYPFSGLCPLVKVLYALTELILACRVTILLYHPSLFKDILKMIVVVYSMYTWYGRYVEWIIHDFMEKNIAYMSRHILKISGSTSTPCIKCISKVYTPVYISHFSFQPFRWKASANILVLI